MPNDAYTLSILARELQSLLEGAKVNRIVQPEKDEIVFTLYAGKTYRLLLSANAANPRCHLTEYAKENPAAAPQFVMTLRKHLMNAVFCTAEQLNGDRILCFTFLSKNELKDEERKKLIIEIMGKYSNIILADEQNKIIGAIKSVSFDVSSVRQVFPGLFYELPPKAEGSTIFEPHGLEKALRDYQGGCLSGFLQTHLNGIAKSTAEEIVFRAEVPQGHPLSDSEINIISQTAASLSPTRVTVAPCILFREHVMRDFFAFPYQSQYGDYQTCDLLNRAADEFYYRSDKQKRFQEHARALRHQVKNMIAKLEKKKGLLLQKLTESEKMEEERIKGELLTANLYAIKPGMPYVTVQNYYDGREMQIPLDPQLTPAQNAQMHYKRYNKLKSGKLHSEENLLECEDMLEYLYSVEESFEKCSEISELNQIRRELAAQGLVRSDPIGRVGGKKESSPRPIEFLFGGFRILVGKNNLQNDELTFSTAAPGDLWLHTKDVHGSHTVILAEGKTIPDQVITCACELAAYYSKAKNSGKTAVDYTQRKFVKKPKGAKPGFVIYTDFQTAYVQPNEHAEYRTENA